MTQANSATPSLDDPLDGLFLNPEQAFDAEKEAAALQRRKQAAERLRERLSCVPFYAARAAKAKAETGCDLGYWSSLLGRVD